MGLDIMSVDRVRMLHCMKRISHILGILKEELDDMYDAMNGDKEKKEVNKDESKCTGS